MNNNKHGIRQFQIGFSINELYVRVSYVNHVHVHNRIHT